MCCVNRGCFIKVGQHVGALEYLLPLEYVETMRVLHDRAPESSLEELKQVIKEDLGKDVITCTIQGGISFARGLQRQHLVLRHSVLHCNIAKTVSKL